MTAAPSTSTVKRALSAHAAIGLLAGALLYLVCVTGVVSVFHAETQRLEQPGAPEMTSISPEAVQRGVDAVLASEAGKPKTTHLYVHMPVPDLPRATITTDSQAVHLRPDGSIAMREENAWSEFVVALHYTLHLPSTVGITIVGILGVMLLALALSGVVAHPRIFRDAFRLRARSTNGVGLADWHNRLSVWTLPFSIAIALTGAIIGVGTLTSWGLAKSAYGGDQEAVYAPIFGGEHPADASPAPTPDVAATLRAMRQQHPAVDVSYVILHDPRTAGQHVQVVGLHDRRLIFGEYYHFDAAGRPEGKAGLSDGTSGQQAAASIYNLHFGNYGGLPVKIAYVFFGTVLSAIAATGVYIWLGKRARRGFAEPRLRAGWTALVAGVPLILALTFVLRIALGNELPFNTLFWVALATLVASAMIRSRSLGLSRTGPPEPARPPVRR